MTYEDLIKSMEAAAEEKKEEILRNADRQAEAIVREAEERAGAIKEEYMARARAIVADRRNRLLYKTRQDARAADIAEREKMLHAVYARVASQMGNFREREDYRALFSRLLSESLAEMGEKDVQVHVDPRDEALCREIVSRLDGNFAVFPDITTAGRVIVSPPDNQV
ncbi:MAG: V-type ATP synthase subunit E, partial [Methanolinea sp.]